MAFSHLGGETKTHPQKCVFWATNDATFFETKSSHPEMDGWKIRFLFGMASRQVRTVSFRECKCVFFLQVYPQKMESCGQSFRTREVMATRPGVTKTAVNLGKSDHLNSI